MSELQAPFDHAPVSETRISAFPLPGWRLALIETLPRAVDGKLGWTGWRLALIETLPRAVDGKLGWTVRLSAYPNADEGDARRSVRHVQSMSTVGLFHAWDQAIEMAKQSDRERQINER